MSDSITVELGDRSYPIHIGAGLLDDPGVLPAATPARQLLVLTNETIAPLYLERVRERFADLKCHHLVLSPFPRTYIATTSA